MADRKGILKMKKDWGKEGVKLLKDLAEKSADLQQSVEAGFSFVELRRKWESLQKRTNDFTVALLGFAWYERLVKRFERDVITKLARETFVEPETREEYHQEFLYWFNNFGQNSGETYSKVIKLYETAMQRSKREEDYSWFKTKKETLQKKHVRYRKYHHLD